MKVERLTSDNYRDLLKSFEYGCSEMPWVGGCEDANVQAKPFFVTLFDEDGNILESVDNKSVRVLSDKPIGVLPTRESMIERVRVIFV